MTFIFELVRDNNYMMVLNIIHTDNMCLKFNHQGPTVQPAECLANRHTHTVAIKINTSSANARGKNQFINSMS